MGGRGERGEEAGGERDGRWSCGGGSGGSLFLSSTFLRASAAWHLRGFAKLIVTGQTIFVVSRKWFLPHVLLGSTKRFAIFCPTKKLAWGLDKRGNLAYNHGILLLRSASLLILLIVLTRLPLSGVRGRAVLLAGFMFPTFAPWASRFSLFSIPLVRHAL